MNWCILLREGNKPVVCLERCQTRIAALPLLKYHRDHLLEAQPFSSVWLRDDVNTDVYFLMHQKVYDTICTLYGSGQALRHAKDNALYLYRIEITCPSS